MSSTPIRKPRPVRAQTVHRVQEGHRSTDVLVGGHKLTVRQLEVLQAIADGKRNEDLAQQYQITLPGVQKYVGQIMDLTGTTSRAAAVAFGMRAGLIK